MKIAATIPREDSPVKIKLPRRKLWDIKKIKSIPKSSPPNGFIGGPARTPSGFPLQPEADPSEALWRKKHAGMTDFRKVQILRSKLRKFTFSFDAPDTPSRMGGELTLILDQRDL